MIMKQNKSFMKRIIVVYHLYIIYSTKIVALFTELYYLIGLDI